MEPEFGLYCRVELEKVPHLCLGTIRIVKSLSCCIPTNGVIHFTTLLLLLLLFVILHLW